MALVGREEVGCASGSGEGTVNDKVGEDDGKDARKSSPQPGRRLRGGKVTGCKETGRKETGRKEMGRKTMRTKETGWKETGGRRREGSVSAVEKGATSQDRKHVNSAALSFPLVTTNGRFLTCWSSYFTVTRIFPTNSTVWFLYVFRTIPAGFSGR